MQALVVRERAEKGTERDENGREKNRGIPETELHRVFSVGLVPRVTNNSPYIPQLTYLTCSHTNITTIPLGATTAFHWQTLLPLDETADSFYYCFK